MREFVPGDIEAGVDKSYPVSQRSIAGRKINIGIQETCKRAVGKIQKRYGNKKRKKDRINNFLHNVILWKRTEIRNRRSANK